MQKTKDIQQPPNVHIAVQNFGPIGKAEIDLRPLTVFVGESNTGKTYLAALIYALHRSFEGFSKFLWSSDVVYELNSIYRERSRSVWANDEPEIVEDADLVEALEKLNTRERPFKFSDLPWEMYDWLHTDPTAHEFFQDELKQCFDLGSISELIRFNENPCNEIKMSLRVCEKDQLLWNFEMQGSESDITTKDHLNKAMLLRDSDEAELHEKFDVEDLLDLLRHPRSERGDLYYLPAARSGIMQSHGVIASSLITRATRIGLERIPEIPAFSGMVARFLTQLIHYDERKNTSDQMEQIAKALENDVLHGNIEIKSAISYGYPEFLYHPHNGEQAIRMSRSSSMVSELAPLVLFLRGVVRPGDTLIIEEPEAHLHPAAQTKVALTLVRLVRVGVHVIITTHSDWLLEQIGNLIREGEVMKLGKSQAEPTTWLTKEEVGAWWFRTDKPVKEIPFEHIAGIEPEEYGEVAEELYNRSVDLRTQLEEATGGTEVEQE